MNQPGTPQPQGPTAPQGPPQGGGLPDLNSGAYPFELILDLLQKGTTDFHFFAMPQPRTSRFRDDQDPYYVNGGFVLNVTSDLHRINSEIRVPSVSDGVRISESVGDAEGKLTARFTIAPNDFPWSPGKEPKPILYDKFRAQRFVMLDSEFTFGDGDDAFSGYGVGRTFPTVVSGRPVALAGGIGNITDGRGKFEGLQGTYALNGIITPEFGFRGSITLRVVDWKQALKSETRIRPVEPGTDPDATYIVLHGQKKNQFEKSGYVFGPNGSLQGITAPAQWRSAEYNFTARGYKGLRSEVSVGQIVGDLNATIITNILAPPGTADAPAAFTTDELYTFFDPNGQTVGTIKTGVVEGDSFNLVFPAAPGQPGLRFAGYGPILSGTGVFEGVSGMLTVNSFIGISPHVLWLMHVLRIVHR